MFIVDGIDFQDEVDYGLIFSLCQVFYCRKLRVSLLCFNSCHESFVTNIWHVYSEKLWFFKMETFFTSTFVFEQ